MNKLIRTFVAMLMFFGMSAFALAQDATSTPDTAMDDTSAVNSSNAVVDTMSTTMTDAEAAYFVDVSRVYYVDPDASTINMETSDETIEAITDNSEDYYGAVVTVQGTLLNFVGSRIFELGEDEILTNSNVLVVNNSNQPFPSSLVEGVALQVTGRVVPSYDYVQDDTAWTYTPYDEAMAADAQNNQNGNGRLNMVNFVHTGYIPGVFGSHTIFEVLNVENITVLDYDGLIASD